MDKDKGKINSMEADTEEFDRLLRAMGRIVLGGKEPVRRLREDAQHVASSLLHPAPVTPPAPKDSIEINRAAREELERFLSEAQREYVRISLENAGYKIRSQPVPKVLPVPVPPPAQPPPPKPKRTRKATPLLDACLTVWRKQPECQDAQPATAIQLLNVVTIQQGVAGHPKLRVSGDKIEWAEGGSLEMKHFKAAFERHFGR